MKIIVISAVLILLAGMLITGCDSDEDVTPAEAISTEPIPAIYTDVDPAEAKYLIDTIPALVIIDVSPIYAQGHLPGAINYPMTNGSLETALSSLNKNVPYFVYCHSDSVSIAAARLMVDAGFDDVYRLEGNYAAWVAAGYEIETGESPPSATGGSDVINNWSPDGIIQFGEYAHEKDFGNYRLFWQNDDRHIYVGMSAQTDGWVAVGFDPSSKMADGDILLGFVKDGMPVIIDMISTGPLGPHHPDNERGGASDIVEFGGAEVEDVTTIEFKRLLVTGDDNDNDLIRGVNKIIWAYGSNDDSSQRHSKRGSAEITLQ